MSRQFKGCKKDTIQKVGKLKAAGFTFKDIGGMLNYSPQRIHQIWHEFHAGRQESTVANDLESALNNGREGVA